MFLHLLKDNQKTPFLQLAIKAAEANDVVELAEKNMLKAYGIEMGITPFYRTDTDIKQVLQELKTVSSDREMRIILFEIMGILVSDKVFDDSELVFLQEVCSAFDIAQEKCDEMLALLNDYSSIYDRIVSVVL